MIVPSLLLASASPRRAQLLRQIGLDPAIDPAGIDETIPSNSTPAEAALTLAEQKASVVAARHAGTDALVIAADTIVSIDDISLGKPTDHDDARAMLCQLSGRTHEVHTGVHVVCTVSGRRCGGIATTRVTMRRIDPEEIASYIATGETDDAAGAYAIQGRAAVFVDRIDGDYTNVVGLPLTLVASILADLGHPVTQTWSPT